MLSIIKIYPPTIKDIITAFRLWLAGKEKKAQIVQLRKFQFA